MLSALQELETSRSKKELELIIAVCWSIWYSRNILIFEGKAEDPHIAVARAIGTVESYRRIKIPADQTIFKHQSCNPQAWRPPPNGWFKVNVDAAIKRSNQTAGLGVAIRDSKGEAVAAAVQKVGLKGNVAYMEAEAINLGFQIAQIAKCQPMIVESDSKEVVDLAWNRKGCLSEIFWQITTIRDSLKRLNRSQIQHVSRSCNKTAHALANVVLNYDDLVEIRLLFTGSL